ncbi:MAG: hypothetical protein Tsb0016_17420 [Sphingomonadales bacterium]
MRFLLLLCLVGMVSGCASSTPQLPPAGQQMLVPDGNLANADSTQLIRLGDRLAAAGDVRGAAGIYERAAARDPSNPEILIKLGDLNWRAGGLRQAVAYYEQALALAPENPEALARRARSHLIQNQPREALALLDRAVAAGAGTAQVWASRGLAFDLLGQPVQAQVDYGKALDLEPGNAGVRINMALSFALAGEYASSLQLLRDLVNAGGVQDQARAALALVYALSGQTDVAVALSGEQGGDGAANQDVFYRVLPNLDLAEKAAAVYLRRLPPGALARAQATKTPQPVEEPISAQPNAAPEPDIMAGGEPVPEPLPYPQAPEPEPEPESDPEPAPAAAPEAAPAPEQELASEPAVRRYWVQLASFRTLEQVRTNWQAIERKDAALAETLSPQVQKVRNAENVLFHRLMADGFTAKADARALCETLTAADISCLITRNDMPAMPLTEALAAID